ncbi:MAG: RNA polymerase sigma factor [Bacteroidales bacterium]|nr:RNA polymerase sigma factor [Bacteroidales bacterium]
MLAEEIEIQVIQRARDGDRKAVRDLYDRYSGYLASVCSRFLTDGGDIKDVLQDSFVKIFSSLDKFDYRGEGSLKAWMRQILVNECLKMMRRRRKSVPIQFEGELPDEVAEDEVVDPPDAGEIPAKVIQEMIRDLPEGYRTVLNLYALEDKSHKEISEMLGISENTSASKLFRARQLLAKKLKEYKEKLDKSKR